MASLKQIKQIITEWYSPRYSRITLKLDPVSKQITAETEEEPAEPRKLSIHLAYPISLAVLVLVIVTYLVVQQSKQFHQTSTKTQHELALLQKQNQTLMEQNRTQSAQLEKALTDTREQLQMVELQNQNIMSTTHNETERLKRQLKVLQNENEDLKRRMNSVSQTRVTPRAPKQPEPRANQATPPNIPSQETVLFSTTD